MSSTKTIMVGFSIAAIASLQKLRPENSVILVDEPDVIRKRNIEEEVKKYSVVHALMPFEYQREHAADAFFASVQHHDVVSVVPIQEYATPFAARLAERFGRPGAGFGAARIMREKNLLRAVSRAFGVNNPLSQVVSTYEEVEQFARMHDDSIIIKPANRQGSVGAVIVHDKSTLRHSWQDSLQRDEGIMTPDRAIPEVTLVEQFVRGNEYSVEALVHKGQIIFSNVTKKYLFEGNKPVEKAHLVPAPLPSAEWDDLVRATQQVLLATSFQTGIVHCEWLLSGGKPWLVECAGRFAGDGIIDLIERAYEFDIVEAYHKLMRGEILFDLPKGAKKAALVRFLGGQDGVVKEVSLNPDAFAVPEVKSHHFSVKAGDRTYAPSMSWHRLGGITLEAPTPELAVELAEKAMQGIGLSYER